MNAVNAVQLLILVWAFPAVCQADDDGDISVICADVTGTVGEDVTLTCNVSLSQECTERCITKYKFYYSENDTEMENCREEFPHDSCEQRNSFTCRFTPATAKTERFRFFVQAQCGSKDIELTVDITEPSKPESDTEAPRKEARNRLTTVTVPRSGNSLGYKNIVIAAVVGCFITILIFMSS